MSREEISSENTGELLCQALSCISVQLKKTDYESAALTVELQAHRDTSYFWVSLRIVNGPFDIWLSLLK
jgi:hypothetical protein